MKPANEVRMYEKLGASISDFPDCDPYFFGSKCPRNSDNPKYFNDNFKYSRNPLKRWLRALGFIQFCFNIKPQGLIICTWELLFPAILVKLFLGCPIIYDVQENYFLNSKVRGGISIIGGNLIRFIEHLSNPFLDSVFLAEKCYRNEMKLFEPKGLVLENKAMPQILDHKTEKREFDLFYGGTIAKQTGLEYLDWICEKTKQDNVKIRVLGHCPLAKDINKLERISKNYENIRITVDSKPIPHSELLKEMAKSKFSLCLYELNRAVENRVPTKLFESLALGVIPVFFNNPAYSRFMLPGVLTINVKTVEEVPDKIKELNGDWASEFPQPEEIFWHLNDSGIKRTVSEVFNLNR